MTNLQTRVVASFIYFPAILLSAYDPRLFALVMTASLTIGWHEFLSFRGRPLGRPMLIRHGLLILLGILPAAAVVANFSMALGLGLLALVLQGFIVFWIFAEKSLSEILQKLGFILLGLVYVTGCFSLLIESIYWPGGREAIWFLFFVVALTDTCAYFSGRKWGKTPFFQAISPSKTLEGVWGGLAGAFVIILVYFWVLRHLQYSVPNLLSLLVLGMSISFLSIFGDLFESLLKRSYRVKDSGNLIPGHGGILDRFDGVMFGAVPLFFYMVLQRGFR